MMDRSHRANLLGMMTTSGRAPSQPAVPVLRQPVSLEVPVRLQGESGELSTFFEDTNTVLVFPEGAVLRVAGQLSPGQSVLLTNRSTRRQLPCRVVYAKPHHGVKGYAEVEFAAPAPGFWEVITAPSDAPHTQPSAYGARAAAPSMHSAPAATARAISSFAQGVTAAADRASDWPAMLPGQSSFGFAGASAFRASAPAGSTSSPRVFSPAPVPPPMDDIETLLAARRIESDAAAQEAAHAASEFAARLLNTAERTAAVPAESPAPSRRRALVIGATVAALLLTVGVSLGAWTLHAEESSLVPSAPSTPAPPAWAVASASFQPESLTGFPLRRVRGKDLAPAMLPAVMRAAADVRRRMAEGQLSAPAVTRRAQIGNDASPEMAYTPEGAATLSLTPVNPRVPAPPAPVESKLQPLRLVSTVKPIYPPIARRMGIHGEVVIHALVDETGKVKDMRVISGPTALHQAARESLQQWKYEPAVLNGKPVATHTAVNIRFQL